MVRYKLIIILILILALFALPSYAAVKKQTLAIDGYKNQVELARGVPIPDANGALDFFESFEPTSAVYSGYDNTGWTETEVTGTVDPDYTSIVHTGWGNHVLRTYKAAGVGNTAKTVFVFPSSYETAHIRVYFYNKTSPISAVRNALTLKDSTTANLIAITQNITGNDLKLRTYNGSTWDATNVDTNTDTWYLIDIFWDITGSNRIAKIFINGHLQGIPYSTPNHSVTNFSDSTAIDRIQLGYTVSNEAVETLWDDLAIRNGTAGSTAYIKNWAADDLLNDKSDDTGWEIPNETKIAMFTLADATDISGNSVKAIRPRGRFKKESATRWMATIGYNYDGTSTRKTDCTEEKFTASYDGSYAEYFSQHLYNCLYDPGGDGIFGSFDWTTITCEASPGTCGVNSLLYTFGVYPGTYSGGISGVILSEAWMDIIYGNSTAGDAFLTHGPVFGAGTDEGSTSTIKVWGRANEATDLMVRSGTTQANIKAGYGGDTALSSPVSVTSTTNFSTPDSGVELTDLTPATTYYIDFLVKQYTDGTPSPPDEMRFEFDAESGILAVGASVTWDSASGAGTVVYKSGTTMMVRVTTYSQLDNNDTITDGTNHVDVNGTSTHWRSTYIFEGEIPLNGVAPTNYWGTLPSFKSHLPDGYTEQFNISPSGDPHEKWLNNQIWNSIGAEGLQQFIMMGDETALEDSDFHTSQELYGKYLLRRGWNAANLYYWQNVLSKTEYARIISDHSIAQNNSNAQGYGDWDGAVTWLPTWKAVQFMRDITPYYTLGSADDYIGTANAGGCTLSASRICDDASPERQFTYTTVSGETPVAVCDNTGNCTHTGDSVSWNAGANTGTLLYYDPDDKIMVVTATGENTLAIDDTVIKVGNGWTTSDALSNIYNFPTVSRYGIYQGVIVNNISDKDATHPNGSFAVVKKNYGTYIDTIANLTSGVANTWTATNSYRFKRAGLFYTFTQGNAKFVMLDIRSRRNSNKTPNGDKFDATAIGMPYTNCWSGGISACLSKDLDGDGDWNDYLIAQTGTSTTEIKHNDPNLQSDITKWDMACAWDSTDTTLRGCALLNEVINYPMSDATYFGSAANPADNGSLATSTVAVTPPANMVNHDLVYMQGRARNSSGTLAISDTGGQSWTCGTQLNEVRTRTLICWAVYNGTWSANPSMSFGSAKNNTLVMHVFRPSDSANTWALDAAQAGTTYKAPATPYKVCISSTGTAPGGNCNTSLVTVNSQAIVIAAWASRDDNTWINPGGDDLGWTKCTSVGGICTGTQSAQYRNNAGYDASQSFAFLLKTDPGQVGVIYQFQGDVAGDPGTRSIISFIESVPSSNYGNIKLEWEIPGLVATDRVRFFESGASDYSSDKLNINHGHIQRTYVEKFLRDNVTDDYWYIIGIETPFKSNEIKKYDKWGDYDNLSIMCSIADDTKWTLEAEVDKALCGNVATRDCYYYYPAADGCLVAGGGFYEKPAIIQVAEIANMYEVSVLSDVSMEEEWYWGENIAGAGDNDGICESGETCAVYIHADICTGGICNQKFDFYYSGLDYLGATHTNSEPFYDRCASRRYLKNKFGYLNKIVIGADRHFSTLSYAPTNADPWPYILSGNTSVYVHATSTRDTRVNGLISHYHKGMGAWKDASATTIGGYALLEVNKEIDGAPTKLIRASIKERDGSLVNLGAAGAGGNRGDPVLGCTDDSCDPLWLPYMTMDITWSCPYNNCDYFGRANGTSEPSISAYPYVWVEDTATPNGNLDISDNAVINADDNTTAIAHWATAICESSPCNQYGQIKIISTSTDGDVGLILKSEASTGYRYALVYDEGSTQLKLVSCNWNTCNFASPLDTETVNLNNDIILSVTIEGNNIRVWTDATNNYPYSASKWQDVADDPTFTLTADGSATAGTYVGIIIKKETAASPVLDNFYSGDVETAGFKPAWATKSTEVCE